MLRRRCLVAVLVVMSASVVGCSGNLPTISDRATITVWRATGRFGLRTGVRLVAADLQTDRHLFLRLYRHTRRVGLCDAVALEREHGARRLMVVQFSEPGRPVVELHILADEDGNPLTVGHGPLDVFSRGPGSPEYRYRRRDVRALAEWLEKHPPPAPPRRAVPARRPTSQPSSP